MLIWKIIYSEKNHTNFYDTWRESVELIIDQIFSLTNDDRPIKPFHGFYLSILQHVDCCLKVFGAKIHFVMETPESIQSIRYVLK